MKLLSGSFSMIKLYLCRIAKRKRLHCSERHPILIYAFMLASPRSEIANLFNLPTPRLRVLANPCEGSHLNIALHYLRPLSISACCA